MKFVQKRSEMMFLVLSCFLTQKNNVFAGHYEPTQLPIRKITNIAQKLKMLGTENPFKGQNQTLHTPFAKMSCM